MCFAALNDVRTAPFYASAQISIDVTTGSGVAVSGRGNWRFLLASASNDSLHSVSVLDAGRAEFAVLARYEVELATG